MELLFLHMQTGAGGSVLCHSVCHHPSSVMRCDCNPVRAEQSLIDGKVSASGLSTVCHSAVHDCEDARVSPDS